MTKLCFVAAALLWAAAAKPIVAQRSSGPRVGLSQVTSGPASLWERSFARGSVPQNQWEKGALIGAGIGAALGLAAYAFEHSYNETRTSDFVIIGPMVIFALIGGMIGSGSRRT